jgi:hypothetical protein
MQRRQVKGTTTKLGRTEWDYWLRAKDYARARTPDRPYSWTRALRP